MANVLKDLFGGKSTASAVPSADSDFADFADVPEPTPAAPVSPASNPLSGLAGGPEAPAAPYTKWYNIHERHSLSEFKAEGIILVAIIVLVVLHLIGARLNRTKARRWAAAHSATLASEFALVGFKGAPIEAGDKTGEELVQALTDANARQGDKVLKEKSLFEYATYATGRANVAFVDVKLTLVKRFNPFQILVEFVLGFFIESLGTPGDSLEAIMYPFDGKEALTVPGAPGAVELKTKDSKSTFDGFVWALVNKNCMKQVRDERYDVSLTFTKDHNKVPAWLTVMSESAEITDAMLTPELIKAAESAGDSFEYLIISDQPVDKPTTIDETVPRKRVFLKYKLPSDNNYEPLVPLFKYFIRVADVLVQSAHFRPEVLRKVKTTREDAIKRIKKASEEEKAEDRALEREKAKKAKRDQELAGLDAKAQKKYLEREREKEIRKATKRQTTRA